MAQYRPDPDDSGLVFNLKKFSGNETIENPSDSDEAPEDISFSSAAASALSQLKLKQLAQKETAELKKKKRQMKDLKLCKQKEEKVQRLKKLSSKKLPDELFKELPHSSTSKSKLNKKGCKQPNLISKTHLKFDEHYNSIPSTLNVATDFNLAVLESKKWKNCLSKPENNSGQCQTNFRQNALSHVKRESTNAVQQAREKLKSCGKLSLI